RTHRVHPNQRLLRTVPCPYTTLVRSHPRHQAWTWWRTVLHQEPALAPGDRTVAGVQVRHRCGAEGCRDDLVRVDEHEAALVTTQLGAQRLEHPQRHVADLVQAPDVEHHHLDLRREPAHLAHHRLGAGEEQVTGQLDHHHSVPVGGEDLLRLRATA